MITRNIVQNVLSVNVTELSPLCEKGLFIILSNYIIFMSYILHRFSMLRVNIVDYYVCKIFCCVLLCVVSSL